MIFFEAILALGLIGWLLFAGATVALFGAIYTFKTRHSVSFVWTLGCLALVAFAFHTQLLGFGKGFMIEQPGEKAGTFIDVINWAAVGMLAFKVIGTWIVGAAVTSVLYWFSFVRDVKSRWVERLEALNTRMKNETKFQGWSVRAKTLVAKALAIGTRSNNVFLTDDFRLSLPESMIRHHREVNRNQYDEFDLLRDVLWAPESAVINDAPVSRVAAVVENIRSLAGTASLRSDSDLLAEAAEKAAADAELVESKITSNLDRLEEALGAVLPPRAKDFKADIAYAATVWPITLLSLILADFLRHVVDLAFTFFRGFLDKVSKVAFGDIGVSKA